MLQTLKNILSRPAYTLVALEGFLGAIIALWWVMRRQSTFVDFYSLTKGTPEYFIPYILLTLAGVFLFGLLLVVAVYGWQNSNTINAKSNASGALGVLLGAIGGACPLCGAFVFSSLGIIWSVSSLPLKGLEIKAASVAVLGAALLMSLKKVGENCDECRIVTPEKTKNYATHFAFLVLLLITGANFITDEITALRGDALSSNIKKIQEDGEGGKYGLYYEAVSKVIPKRGFKAKIVPGDVFVKLADKGVIDIKKFTALYERRGGLAENQLKILTAGSREPIVINADNANFWVNMFWALGLANHTGFNKESPLNGEMLFNFASTGGWTLGEARNGGKYFNQFNILQLTPRQEALVLEIARNTYRPCCGNSTFFQDCNHGSALLGILELGASQGLSEKELYQTALAFNSFWFPDIYVKTALYMKVFQKTDWEDVNPARMMSFNYSSAPGWRKNIAPKIEEIEHLIPEVKSASGCGV